MGEAYRQDIGLLKVCGAASATLGLPLTLGVKGFLWHQRPFRMHPGATCDTSRGDEGLETMTEDGWKTYESLTVQARPGVRRDPVFHVLGRDGLDEGSHLHEGTRRRIDARAKPGDSSGSSSSDSWRSATRFR